MKCSARAQRDWYEADRVVSVELPRYRQRHQAMLDAEAELTRAVEVEAAEEKYAMLEDARARLQQLIESTEVVVCPVLHA